MDIHLDALELEDCGGPPSVGLRDAPFASEHLAGALIEVAPGKLGWPYHWEAAQEEWLLVLEGTPTVRTPAGESTLAPGDLVCFVAGPDGAHTFRNATDRPVRVLMLCNRADVNVIHYPDQDRVGWDTPWDQGSSRPGHHVPYWDQAP